MGVFDKIFKKQPKEDSPSARDESALANVNDAGTLEFVQISVDRERELKGYEKLPFAELASFGAAFANLATPLRTAVQTVHIPVDGIYRAHSMGKRGVLAQKDGYNLATIMDHGKIVGQTRWEKLNDLSGSVTTTLPYDPTLLILAVALREIEGRFDEIKEIGTEILEFLEQDKESQLRGDMAYLQDVLKNYKHNCGNEKYKTNQHIKVLDIKKDAMDKLAFYRERIDKRREKKQGALHNTRSVNEQREAVLKELKNYQFSLYIFAFASFLEIFLLENFNSDYLSGIADDIGRRSDEYNALYASCAAQIEGAARSALENQVTSGVGSALKMMGDTIAKIPKISDTQLDESLISMGENLLQHKETCSKETVRSLEIVRDSAVHPFMESIRTVDQLYNKPIDVLFDRDYLYIKRAAA